MPQIIDLTMPIEPHFRWGVERGLKADFAKGDAFQVTYLGMTVHGFTHMDSPRHIDRDGWTTSSMALDQVCGPAAVVDLTGIAANTAIAPDLLAPKAGHVEAGDIVLLKTCWEDVHSHHTPEFWTNAPYMTREASRWLLDRKIKALAVDFPQDYPIRGLLTGESAPIEDFVTHDVLLRNGVVLIEYICNLKAVAGPRTTVYALPLKLPDSDGAPARVIAVEG